MLLFLLANEQFVLTFNVIIILVLSLFLFYISKEIRLKKLFLNISLIFLGLVALLFLLANEQFVLTFSAIIILVAILYYTNVDINVKKNKNSQKVSALYFLIPGIALLIYPGVIISNAMLWANVSKSDIFTHVFLWLTTCYPIIFFLCLFLFYISREIRLKKIFIIIPFIYLGLCFFSIFLALTLQSIFK